MIVLRGLALCAALLADPGLTPDEMQRGCALAPVAIEAAEATGQPADLLLAMAWRESRFRIEQRNGRHCGAWQTRAWERVGKPWGLTCAELQQPQPGALAGALVLVYFRNLVGGDTAKALQRYAGCKNGCSWYSDSILERVGVWRRRAAAK